MNDLQLIRHELHTTSEDSIAIRLVPHIQVAVRYIITAEVTAAAHIINRATVFIAIAQPQTPIDRQLRLGTGTPIPQATREEAVTVQCPLSPSYFHTVTVVSWGIHLGRYMEVAGEGELPHITLVLVDSGGVVGSLDAAIHAGAEDVLALPDDEHQAPRIAHTSKEIAKAATVTRGLVEQFRSVWSGRSKKSTDRRTLEGVQTAALNHLWPQ
mmetsp:Transcript_3637/g.8272  ORF Transcript_3637/g.8272 Transcript_3637/m.8272 type:complete len:212 (-) Transcript_3637:1613-2248(-)